MIIRKLFKFENAHIVRNCSTKRCSQSIHGHSYKVEILIESNFLDNGQMVYDFGLTKLYIKDMIDSFDHSISIWSGDDKSYIETLKAFSKRWVELPVSPSAEQLSRVIFLLVDKILNQTKMINGENGVKLQSIIVHETDTGYAQCFRDDIENINMGLIDIEKVIFSDEIVHEWRDKLMFEKIKSKGLFENPKIV
ncbi:MAG: 6-carboxytetrahydropterin synthase [Campylobacterales bacterium]|nr:6-carboxytetrahydropterin synthase [Campylobacterales bacterium]